MIDGKSYFKFERGTRAPDGIHGKEIKANEIKANEIPMTLKDKFNIAMIVLTYLAAATMSYYWG